MNIAIAEMRTLVLNTDFQPLSWAPLSLWSWQDAFTAVMQERVTLLETYKDAVVRSARQTWEVPAVVALKRYRQRKGVAFTRFNLFLRDEFRCQYCGRQLNVKDLTFDHVVPRCRGGKTDWWNVVASCAAHNLQKGHKTLQKSGLSLLRHPFEPTPFQIDAAARRVFHKAGDLHQTWHDYLYWDSELEA